MLRHSNPTRRPRTRPFGEGRRPRLLRKRGSAATIRSDRFRPGRGEELMKTLEFQATLGPGGTLTVPAEVAQQVPPEQPLRVIVLLPDSDEDREWERFTAEQFLQGYADGDAIYDDF